MEKTSTLNLRVNPDVKRRAEEVLSQLGIPMSKAMEQYNRIADCNTYINVFSPRLL